MLEHFLLRWKVFLNVKQTSCGVDSTHSDTSCRWINCSLSHLSLGTTLNRLPTEVIFNFILSLSLKRLTTLDLGASFVLQILLVQLELFDLLLKLVNDFEHFKFGVDWAILVRIGILPLFVVLTRSAKVIHELFDVG